MYGGLGARDDALASFPPCLAVGRSVPVLMQYVGDTPSSSATPDARVRGHSYREYRTAHTHKIRPRTRVSPTLLTFCRVDAPAEQQVSASSTWTAGGPAQGGMNSRHAVELPAEARASAQLSTVALRARRGGTNPECEDPPSNAQPLRGLFRQDPDLQQRCESTGVEGKASGCPGGTTAAPCTDYSPEWRIPAGEHFELAHGGPVKRGQKGCSAPVPFRL